MAKHEPRELQDGQGLRCTGCCTGCTLPGHSCREVQARLDGLYGAIYEERDRLVDHLGQVQTLLVQTRARVMNNDLAVAGFKVSPHVVLFGNDLCVSEFPFQDDLEGLQQKHRFLQHVLVVNTNRQHAQLKGEVRQLRTLTADLKLKLRIDLSQTWSA